MPHRPPKDQEIEDEFEDDDDSEEENLDEGLEPEDEEPDGAPVEEVEEVDDTPPPLRGRDLNAELFRSAVASVREVIPAWVMSAELLLGHSVDLIPDFEALEGRFDLIQPFVHLAIAGALEALGKVRFDPIFGPAIVPVDRIVIRPCPSGQNKPAADLEDNSMTIWVPLEDERPPTAEIAAAMRAALGDRKNNTDFV